MIQLIAVIILIGSFLGVLAILIRKMPILSSLPETPENLLQETFWLKIKKRIKDFPVLKYFSSDIFLQKILSKIRVITLKIENKTGTWLQDLREKSKKKISQADNYWHELKKKTAPKREIKK